ncbi:hypothetical protein CBR_g36239 [Chara braunii]|uniref:Uncharacterized protein n=1 Tax=Chara braunii TaxID=69332 RepID=A0A388LKC4_CHABU|nr:hypothetical protein CBR_g36239 [Chara braunii]|eukprot:GBG82711.1 hypothetical protein CBR_g36239 [Chara braunii]
MERWNWQENVARLLALREVYPNARRTRRKLWTVSSTRSSSECCAPGGGGRAAAAAAAAGGGGGRGGGSSPLLLDCAKALELWLEADSIRNFSAKYCHLDPPPRSTIAAAFSPDGSSLASTHGDHTVKVVSCRTGACLKVLYGHRRTPWVVRFHPLIPQIVASGSLDNEVRLWDIGTGSGECFRSHDFGRPIASLAFHPHGEILAVASGHKLYMWQYKKKREEHSQPVIVLRTRKTLRAVHFHPYGAPLLLTAEVDSGESPQQLATSSSRPISRFFPLPASACHPPPHSAPAAPHHLLANGFSVTPVFPFGSWLLPTLRNLPRRVFSNTTTSDSPRNDCHSREGMMMGGDRTAVAGQQGHRHRHHQRGGMGGRVNLGAAGASGGRDGGAQRLSNSSSSISDARSRSAGEDTLDGVRDPDPVGTGGGEEVSRRVAALLSRDGGGDASHPSPMDLSPAVGGGSVGGNSSARMHTLDGGERDPDAVAAGGDDVSRRVSAPLAKDGEEASHPSPMDFSPTGGGGGGGSLDGNSATRMDTLDGVRDPDPAATGGAEEGSRGVSRDVGDAAHPSSAMAASPAVDGSVGGNSATRMLDSDGAGSCPRNGMVGAAMRSNLENSGLPSGHGRPSSRARAAGEKAAGLRGGGGSATARARQYQEAHGGSGQALGGNSGREECRRDGNDVGAADRAWIPWGAWGGQTGAGTAAGQFSGPTESSPGLGLGLGMGMGMGGPGDVLGGWEIPFVQQVLQESQQAAAGVPGTVPGVRGNEGAAGRRQSGGGGSRNHAGEDRSGGAHAPQQQRPSQQHAAMPMASVAMAAAVAAARAAARAGAGMLGAAGAGIGAGIGAQLGAGAALGAAALSSGGGGDAATEAARHVQLDAAGAAGAAAAAVVSMQALASAQATESPCTVMLRIWPHDVQAPCDSLLAQKCKLVIPHAVLCSEMGAHFSPCGRFLAACVACVAMEVRPSSSGTGNGTGVGAQGNYGQRSPMELPCPPVSARNSMYELRVYSLEKHSFGQVLASRAVRAAHCLTSIQISPTSSHVLLAYGRRHHTLLKSFSASGSGKQLIPVYTILEIYRISDMSLVGVLPSAEDEVNVACFHSRVGGGLVYGTKEGRLRLMVHDRQRRSSDSQSGFEDGVIHTRMVDDLHFDEGWLFHDGA